MYIAYAAPVHVPRAEPCWRWIKSGTDNSGANPRNPNRPPRRVTFGLHLILPKYPRASGVDGDRQRPRTAGRRCPRRNLLKKDIAGDETTLLTHPDDARLHRDLASLLSRGWGEPTRRLPHLERAPALEPNSSWIASITSSVLFLFELLILFDAAATHFRRAVELKPDDAESYNGLGAIAYACRATDEAIPLVPAVGARSRQRARALQPGSNLRREGRSTEGDRLRAKAALAMNSMIPMRTSVSARGCSWERGQAGAAAPHYREKMRLKWHLVSATDEDPLALATSDRAVRATTARARVGGGRSGAADGFQSCC